MNEYNYNLITDYLTQEAQIILELNVEEIDQAINKLIMAEQNHKHIYCFGNGGSASTASHFANDFTKGIPTKNFQVTCLSDNIATITAIANDISYDLIYSYQLAHLLQEGDIVVAISGSGNSTNIINAANYAKEQGNLVIGFTGFNGGKLKKLSDISLHVPINNMQIVEDVHLLFNHVMMRTINLRIGS